MLYVVVPFLAPPSNAQDSSRQREEKNTAPKLTKRLKNQTPRPNRPTRPEYPGWIGDGVDPPTSLSTAPSNPNHRIIQATPNQSTRSVPHQPPPNHGIQPSPLPIPPNRRQPAIHTLPRRTTGPSTGARNQNSMARI
ncbi:hypothetical protein BDW02DRAFT_648117 [Decorospora gaudefroyi]|uniref:Uncharacterized protein n=1 Tax=Decorospora gaudefroyi TaxID=184978 RepID=A0A6A5KBI7_9PLEO|nr:hypothetical protein BDW02DRAFT_648117 [Decorospora gaudefroyi]